MLLKSGILPPGERGGVATLSGMRGEEDGVVVRRSGREEDFGVEVCFKSGRYVLESGVRGMVLRSGVGGWL